MADPSLLTSTELLAAATSVLVSDTLGDSSYYVVDEALRGSWPTENVRIFEDRYSIIAVVVYDTWSSLLGGWADAQGALVDLISKHLSRTEAKAWDGYLVLMTSAPLHPDQWHEAVQIRYDTHRVRKLLATGDEISSLADVERVLLPLLPLELTWEGNEPEQALEMLPALLSKRGIREGASTALINAFLNQNPLVEALEDYRKDNETGQS